MDIGQAILCLRKTRGLTQKQVATRANVSPSYLCRVENGIRKPSGIHMEMIAHGLGVPTFLIWALCAEESQFNGQLELMRLHARIVAVALLPEELPDLPEEVK